MRRRYLKDIVRVLPEPKADGLVERLRKALDGLEEEEHLFRNAADDLVDDRVG